MDASVKLIRGRSEDQVKRLKAIQRAMCGRVHADLLRHWALLDAAV